MSVRVQTQRLNRFTDPWIYVIGLTAGVTFLIWVGGHFLGTLVTSSSFSIDPEETVTLPPMEITPSPIGALRIEAQASIPTNRWVTYEIQVRDRQGVVLASGVKQAWNESGTWHEEGESGTWSESDLAGGLDVQSDQRESITLAVQVLDYTDTSGVDIDEPVALRITVRNGVIDGRYLLAGLIGTVGMLGLSLVAVQTTGRKVIGKSILDSDVGDRGVCGGSDRLIRLTVTIRSDETSPQSMQVKVFVNDSQGEQIYAHVFPVRLRLKWEDRQVEKGTGKLTAFFLLEPRNSYGFYVEVSPDGPVDETILTVRDGTKTLGAVDVVHITPP